MSYTSLRHPLARAAEICCSAPQHKQKSDHDEALRPHHMAFLLDHHIDHGYLKRLQLVSVLAQEITRRLSIGGVEGAEGREGQLVGVGPQHEHTRTSARLYQSASISSWI
ncbi:hypothetical protein HYDPIDRAFT_120268 [Hydnomerulius pinastri MD-312]|uniref:Uncharacterized protein n=1 Tax=Hydnomerulius pinastri MD-312 TaxID=994086 RepID=A0A0C9VK39_9AGAM|nr:hypothetical protein HYDPIDRAFT_120268 [Hydnomerulius pinastri MD-312]